MSQQEQSILRKIGGLRALDDTDRSRATRQLALDIRSLPTSPARLGLADALANLATEGDFGRDTLQDVATTLADALRTAPPSPANGQPAAEYIELAELVRYEHVRTALDAPQLNEAMHQLAALDRRRAAADFTLTDLQGRPWSLRAQRGKVVLVNFWATWCPPCRKEIPDLEALYGRFKDQGLEVLAISDERDAVVRPFVADHGMTYTVLLDTGRRVNDMFGITGIPNSFVFDRQGRLAATAIDMRTQKQLLAMLARAGIQ